MLPKLDLKCYKAISHTLIITKALNPSNMWQLHYIETKKNTKTIKSQQLEIKIKIKKRRNNGMGEKPTPL